MNKTIKSGVRELLFRMISKFEEKQQEKDVEFKRKQDCLRVVLNFLGNLKDVAGVDEIVKTIENLSNLEQKDRIRTQNQYLDDIASITGKKRPHKPTVSDLDSFDIDAIRNKINEFYIVRKQVPTLRTLLVELRESIGFNGCRETLRRLLLSNGYEFKKNKNERSLLIERYDISAWRHRFLRTMALKRREGKSIIYLDETYIHKNYKPKKSWQGPSTSGAIENVSTGKRYIIVHAGSEKGPVPNSLLVFSSKSKMADYHHDMNAVNFNKWLREKLIPNLNEPSVIVMDNASYHSIIVNKAPTSQNRKDDIREWLTLNNIPFEDYHTKAELLCFVKRNIPEPVYEADELLKENGHEVLRLPPYHCDLNAIELIWSLAKRKVASKNLGLDAAEFERIIKDSFESITSEEWKKMTDHVIHVENKYKERDRITENNLESFIINVGNSDSSDSNESFQIEVLDSDFDYGSE
ncbi:hypothetical protein HF086_015625 [Spodoptera exigua]|uniref:Tc1-like transposase DDE domain-containing protein n=1 Tax=Spodoptera exigua TaxID=7107 RepID=A0A922MP69_SPOEX|nr:hypothetical protein HF086_015625 [Spodoptera exigua]